MTKYMLMLCLIGTLLAAQVSTGIPDQSLDRPLGNSGNDLLKIRRVGGYFDTTYSIKGLIKLLAEMNNGYVAYNVASWVGESGATSGHEYDAVNLLKTELLAFYNKFPHGSEVFYSTLNNGETAYVDTYGYHLDNQGTDENGQTVSYVPTYEDALNTSDAHHTYTLNFYGGRNTAAGPDISSHTEEVEITTQNGNIYKIYAYDTTTPLVLDMDGDDRLEASKGQWLPHTLAKNTKLFDFDMNGDGFNELVEWVGPNDGLLLTYTPGEKVTGNNLFGFSEGFKDGFEELSKLDTNADNKITGTELDTLSVWQDKNQNAVVDAGEVMSVKDLGITEIYVRHDNFISYFVQNGKNRTMWDWFPVMMMAKQTKNE